MTNAAKPDRTTPPRRFRRTVAALLLGTTVLTGPFLVATPPTARAEAPVSAAAEAPASFADLAARVSPAVVNVSATLGDRTDAADGPGAERAVPRLPGMPPGSPFEEFFRRFQDPSGQGQDGPDAGPQMPQGRRGSLGSGFVIDADGHIVTNNHVIDGARKITVTLQDGTTLPATLVGRDAKTDIALLKVEAGKPLAHLEWGDSDAARVGDWVMAVGNPFGLGGTVTRGIVSARGRDIHSGPYDDYLQLDAAINRGNSGGPTFALDGRVIGINTAIYSPNGGSVGIGFAIPSNLARQVVAQLKENGRVERGWLGVTIQEITPDIAEGLGLPASGDGPVRGALVADVAAGSPAARAGLRQGDVILSYDGRPVEGVRALTRRVADSKAGGTVELTVLRQGRETTMAVAIDRLPAEPQVASAGEGPAGTTAVEPVRGLSLAPLDRAARARLGLPAGVTGVVVTGVSPRAGDVPVRPGDVIVKVGDKAVTTPAEVSRVVAAAEKAGRKAVLLLVNRGGAESFVPLRLMPA